MQSTPIKHSNKTNSLRVLATVDIEQLKSLVISISDQVWEKETASRKNAFACFHHTQHIIFRFPYDFHDRTHVENKPGWPIWQPILQPIIDASVACYHYKSGQLGAVMLARLKAGGEIDRHIDGSLSYYFLHKIHVPLFTNPGVSMYIEPKSYHLEEGKAYEVNNIVHHAVKNTGASDRIHLIFEYFNADRRD